MYCVHCGKQIDDASKFCQHCGKATLIATTKIETINNSQSDSTNTANLESYVINQPSINKRKEFSFKPKHWVLLGCCSFLVIAMIIIFFFGGKSGIVGKVDSLLEDDLNASVKITTLYYNEDLQGCLVEFTSGYSSDVAAVYMESKEILYDSDFDYYTNKFNNATNSSERGKWSSKVLEYSDLAEWNFAITVMNADGKSEYNGWKKIK